MAEGKKPRFQELLSEQCGNVQNPAIKSHES
jgi:hypothetical protein